MENGHLAENLASVRLVEVLLAGPVWPLDGDGLFEAGCSRVSDPLEMSLGMRAPDN